MKALKLLLILCIVFLSATPAYSNEERRFYVINDFSKGLNSQTNPYILPPNQATECFNIRINSEYGALAKRNVLLEDGSAGSAAITSLHRFYLSDGNQHTLVTTGTDLKRLVTDCADIVLMEDLSDGKRWNWITFQDLAIGTNAYDQPIKFDGHTSDAPDTDGGRTVYNMCAELGAPFAELNTGTDLDANSWYQYRIAHYDGTNYDYSTARSNPILTGSTVHNIALTDVPLGPTGTTIRYIYRTEGKASKAAVLAETNFYLVGSIADNTTTTYNDTTDDATLLLNSAPTWDTVSGASEENCTPPLGSLMILHDQRVFIAGNTTYPSRIYWSEINKPDIFDPDNYDDIRPDDGDNITLMAEYYGIMNIGKDNSMQKYYTDGNQTTDWYVSDLYSTIGCVAPYSVSVSPKGIIYLSRDGLYMFNGQNVTHMSDTVTPVIDDISDSNIEECFGYYDKNKYYLAYPSTSSGSAINDRVLIYNFTRDAYVIDTANINCFEALAAGTDTGQLYAGDSTSGGYIFTLEASDTFLDQSYKREFEAGTYDDARARGTEDKPIIEIGWRTIDEMTGTINEQPGIVDRPDTEGSWTSPIFGIRADNFRRLYWNESLGAYGDVNMYIRTGATPAACQAAAWSSAFTNPNGSDVSEESTNNYVQIKAELKTSNINYTPILKSVGGYVIRLSYLPIGSQYETSVFSLWKTGWTNFNVPGYRKILKKIRVYYEGTEGTLNFNFINDEGDIDRTFEIDLSVDGNDDLDDNIISADDYKIFTYYPPMNTETTPSLIGEWWMFTITEEGDDYWQINRIEVMYELEPLLI